jgi:hypothetical protein
MSSVKPSARSARSELLPLYLKGRTATQKPSSSRIAECETPEPGVVAGRAAAEEIGTGRAEAPVPAVRARSRNSLLTSRAVCTRWRGSFSRQRRMMRARSLGRSERVSVTEGGSSRKIAEVNSAEDWPVNGRRPVHISWRRTPREKMSVRWSSARPETCSGDMYAGVPITTPACVWAEVRVASPLELSPRTSFAKPKSRILTRPSWVTITLAGLRSR